MTIKRFTIFFSIIVFLLILSSCKVKPINIEDTKSTDTTDTLTSNIEVESVSPPITKEPIVEIKTVFENVSNFSLAPLEYLVAQEYLHSNINEKNSDESAIDITKEFTTILYPWLFLENDALVKDQYHVVENDYYNYVIASANFTELIIRELNLEKEDPYGKVLLKDVNFLLAYLGFDLCNYKKINEQNLLYENGQYYIIFSKDEVENVSKIYQDMGIYLHLGTSLNANGEIINPDQIFTITVEYYINEYGIEHANYTSTFSVKVYKVGEKNIIIPSKIKYKSSAWQFTPKNKLKEDISITNIEDWLDLGLFPRGQSYEQISEFIKNTTTDEQSEKYQKSGLRISSYTITRTKNNPMFDYYYSTSEVAYNEETVYVTFTAEYDKYGLYEKGKTYTIVPYYSAYELIFEHVERKYHELQYLNNPAVKYVLDWQTFSDNYYDYDSVSLYFIVMRLHRLGITNYPHGATSEQIKTYVKKYFNYDYPIEDNLQDIANETSYPILTRTVLDVRYEGDVTIVTVQYYGDLSQFVKSELREYHLKFDGKEYYPIKMVILESTDQPIAYDSV